MRVKKKGELEYFIGRRYGDFSRLHKRLRLELPGKILPNLPKKNKSSTKASGLFSGVMGGKDDEDDDASISSVSTQMTGLNMAGNKSGSDSTQNLTVNSMRPQPPASILTWLTHR